MGYNKQSEVYLGFHESIFNQILKQVQRQRPSLFNHATSDFISKPSLLCETIDVHSAVKEFETDNPLVSEIAYLPIMGYEGPFGMSLCFQLVDVGIDLHPNNRFSNLKLAPAFITNRFSLRVKICSGLACPTIATMDEIVDLKKRAGQELQGVPFNKSELQRFTLEFFIIASLENKEGQLSLVVHQTDIKDITPDGMEKAIECYALTQLRLGVLPKLKLDMNKVLSDIFAEVLPSLGVGLAKRNPNPSVKNDKIEFFFSTTSKN